MSFKKPNFFIIGAPKCGTTSLANWLRNHESIFMVDIKEPHHFNTDGIRWIKNRDEYNKLFINANDYHTAIGEASTHYIYSNVAIDSILKYSPVAKFIACVRNPVEMAQSLHRERLYQGEEVVNDFKEAWEIQKIRKAGKAVPNTVKEDPSRLFYGDLCSLGNKIRNLFKIVERDRIKVIVLDDMKKNPKKVYTEVLRFLNVEDNNKQVFDVFNRSKFSKYPRLNYVLQRISQIKQKMGVTTPLGIRKVINKFLTVEKQKPGLDPEFKLRLKKYFYKDILLLNEFTDRELKGWL